MPRLWVGSAFRARSVGRATVSLVRSWVRSCLAIRAGAAADVGGVGGPVAGGSALPGDGDGDVDAEHAGEECGGEFGGELEQRGGARLSGLDAEVFESLSEVGGADR